MKSKKLFFIACAIIIALGFGIYKAHYIPKTTLSEIALANIEALADSETGGYYLKCYKTVYCESTTVREERVYCGTCASIVCTSWSNESTCRKN